MSKTNLNQKKKCCSLTTFIIGLSSVGIIGGTGIIIGAKYLNRSQRQFGDLNQVILLQKQKLESYNKEIKKLQDIIKTKDSKIDKLERWQDQKSFITVNEETLERDIQRYTQLSDKNKKIIVNTVIEQAKKYNINPLILYGLLETESSLRFWIEHKPVRLKINGRRMTVRAVGLGGVVWEWWGNKLKKAGIAQVRSDLFNPEINIKAVAFILNELSKEDLLKGTKSKDISMLRRFFGGNYKSYSDKIDRKIMEIIRPNLYRY